jgi:predicted enzyme related to lactoylglutathione lyase
MPIRTAPWPTGTPCWVDLSVPDVDAAKEFYAAVFGWTYLDLGEEFGHYQMCQRDGHSAAGIGPQQSPDQPPAWMTYLASDAVDDTAQKITENGGTVLAGPFDVPRAGRMCIALDSQGAAFGVWQATKGIGAEIYNEPGSLVWNEAAETDADAARKFYAAVFGYSYQPVEGTGGEYTTFHREGEPLGGIGGLGNRPPETPPHWMSYFTVADTDAALAAAIERGATVLGEPADTPYGRMASITDPQGATFSVIGVTPSP